MNHGISLFCPLAKMRIILVFIDGRGGGQHFFVPPGMVNIVRRDVYAVAISMTIQKNGKREQMHLIFGQKRRPQIA